jgi:hypothetical protein
MQQVCERWKCVADTWLEIVVEGGKCLDQSIERKVDWNETDRKKILRVWTRINELNSVNYIASNDKMVMIGELGGCGRKWYYYLYWDAVWDLSVGTGRERETPQSVSVRRFRTFTSQLSAVWRSGGCRWQLWRTCCRYFFHVFASVSRATYPRSIKIQNLKIEYNFFV